ncbi:alpha/beta hydrolase [Pinirhizobacter sp.]|uniref:alpha/beta fold hydrolase n=1 Tax=Pinirhizobacter sp. TaxID=2950432 RepID=UPI002F40F759
MTDANNLPTIILVHGAWVDGSSWAHVIVALADRGYKVIAAPLPLASLKADIDSLQAVIDRTEGSVVLVGHAYAGAVVSGIQDERVSALVFISGLAPAQSETVADVFYRDTQHPDAPKLAPEPDGRFWLAADSFSTAFAQNADKKTLTVMASVQRPIAAPCITEPMGPTLWSKRPSWYLVALDDRMIPTPTQRFLAQRMNATSREAAVDHCPMVTAPDEVVSIVDEAARLGTKTR